MQGLAPGPSPPNQVGSYYNHYAIESAFKKAMNLDTMKPQWKSGGDLSQLKRKSGKAQV
jgi:hypothetical protein